MIKKSSPGLPVDAQTETEPLTPEEQQLQALWRNQLETEADDLDFNVVNKLSAARHKAIAQLPTSQSPLSSLASWFSLSAMVGVTSIAILAFVLGNKLLPVSSVDDFVPDSQVQMPQTLMEDLAMLSASEEIEFYQSIQFLEWLDSNS